MQSGNNISARKKARLIAFYLPQYHPIPENDAWWCKGFTEWTNVAKAKPLFEGHMQPHLPADLGFYDLRLPEAREAQAALAGQYGLEGFCYWHYWFGGGRRLLQRPFDEVVKSGKPDFPFCLGWANQTWSGIWHGAPGRLLIRQSYPGPRDYEAHFYCLLEAFHDTRYMTVGGKKIFLIYDTPNLPDIKAFTGQWQELAAREGMGGFHFIAGGLGHSPKAFGCDAILEATTFGTLPRDHTHSQKHGQDIFSELMPSRCSYAEFAAFVLKRKLAPCQYPVVIPNWDNTPRSGINGLVIYGSTPQMFKRVLLDALRKISGVADPEERIIFIKSWNEWAEGNYLEPDTEYGHEYLKVVRQCVCEGSSH